MLFRSRRYLDTLIEVSQTVAGQGSPDDPRGWLEREIDRQSAQISDSVAADPVYPFSYDQFTQDVSVELGFGRDRPVYVTCEVSRMADPGAPEDACGSVLNPPSTLNSLGVR